MTTDNERTTRLQQRQRRKDGYGDVGVVGYEDASGVPVPVQGDEGGPWFKVPPFTEAADILFEDQPVPDLDNEPYAASPSIEVADYRLITLYLSLVGDTGDPSQLSIVPEARRGLSGPFLPIGVIDATPSTVTLAAPFNVYGAGFISRTIAPNELRTLPLAAGEVRNLVLTWDVSGYEAWRFSYGELVAGSNSVLSAYFSRGQ